jgi:hypothetical protein
VSQPRCLGELRIGHVYAHDPSGHPHLESSDEAVHSRSTAKIDDLLARLKVGEVKEISDAGE